MHHRGSRVKIAPGPPTL